MCKTVERPIKNKQTLGCSVFSLVEIVVFNVSIDNLCHQWHISDVQHKAQLQNYEHHKMELTVVELSDVLEVVE